MYLKSANILKMTLFGTIILMLTSAVASERVKKPFTLELLFISRITGTEPQIPTDCRLGGQIAVDSANNRSDFLADYNVRLSFADEKSLSVNTVKFYMNYTETFRDQAAQLANKNVYPSPITVGPWITNGCKAIGSFLHIIKYITISTMCTGTILTDRQKYPNLFLTLQTNNPKVYGWIRFMKEIGGWKRCALLTFSDNANDFSAALAFQNAAIDQGVDVVWFDSVIQFDLKTAQSLKESDARIIMVYISNVPNTVQVFCYSYLAGIRGPRYVFLSIDQSMPNPLNYPEVSLPPGCTRNMLAEQIKYTLHMAMGTDDSIDPFQKTDFGYNKPEFDAIFDRMKDGMPRSLDYDYRLPCHDATMQALISLDRAEQKLKAWNLSIRDFQNQIYRKQVSQAVYKEVLRSDYQGLHASRVKYDDTGSLVTQYNFLTYWTPETLFRKVFAIQKLDLLPLYDYKSYRVQQVGNFQWLTADWNPPRDGRFYMKIILEPSMNASIIISIFAGLLAVVQFVGLVSNFSLLKRNTSMPLTKSFGLTGCLLLDASAIASALKTTYSPYVLETCRVVLLTVALSLINGVLAFRPVIFAWTIKKLARPRTESERRTSSNRISTLSITVEERVVHQGRPQNANHRVKAFSTSSDSYSTKVIGKNDLIAAQSKCLLALAFFALLHVEMLTAWLLEDSGLTCRSMMPSEAYYDEAQDTQIEKYVTICYASNPRYHQNWLFAIASIHFLLLGAACFAVFDMRQSKRSAACPEFTAIAIGVANATTLMLVSFFIVLLLAGDVVAQRIAVAILSLLLSAICSTTWLYSIFARRSPAPRVSRISSLS